MSSVKKRPDYICQEWLDKEHNAKSAATDHIDLIRLLTGRKSRYKPKYQPGDAPAKERPKDIGDQIIDIRCTVGENLQKLNDGRTGKPEEKGFVECSKALPENREKETQRHKQHHIQEAVGKIRKHVGKGNEIQIGTKADVTDIRQSHHCKHTAKINSKEEKTKGSLPVMKQTFIQV